MSSTEKLVYEERASRMNEAKELAREDANANETPTPTKPKDMTKQETEFQSALTALKKDPDWIFECCWDGCDWQFEDALDLVEHCVQEPKGHVPKYFSDKSPTGSTTEGEFQCHWKNCARVKKGVNPFPNLARLLKHVKDIHIMKGNGRIIHPDMRSKNCTTSRNPKPTRKGGKTPNSNGFGNRGGNSRKSLGALNQSSPFSIPPTSVSLDSAQTVAAAASPVPTPQPQIVQQPVQPPEPLFVAVPPRPQKLLHSEAYIRYIESLHNDQRSVSNWESTLKATPETVPAPEPDKLPTHWLGNGPGPNSSILDALWNLRNFMMADSLNLVPKKPSQF
jgi:protein polybromo-1